MADQGDQDQSYDVDFSAEEAAMQEAHQQLTTSQVMQDVPLMGAFSPAMQAAAMQNMADAKGRMEAKAQLAHAASSDSMMRVDPDQVDKLANFFKDEADALRSQQRLVAELGNVAPPGTDPVSKGATKEYRQVGVGDDQAYLDNFMKLATLFDNTSAELRSSAQQTRSDEQGAEESMGKASRA